jgi:hypothetical protein
MKLILILIAAIIPLLGAETMTSTYLVTKSTTAESKALFSAKLVRMNAAKLHWYDNSPVVRVELSPKALTDLQTDPDVELVIPDQQFPTYGPPAPPLPPPDVKPISCSAAAVLPTPPAIVPTVAPGAVPNVPMQMPMMPGGGVGLMPGIGNPMMQPALGLADALAGGVAQKLLNRPPACKVTISKDTAKYPGQGGEGLIEVKATGSCAWQAQASVGWITILSGAGVSGSGIISYKVNPARASLAQLQSGSSPQQAEAP